ncbi:MAG: hypothetical protein PVJ21_01535 [Anaerolineales bacterium]|jgi:hypothetical protein
MVANWKIITAKHWLNSVKAAGCWGSSSALEDTENLPDPDVLAEEIVESLQSALAQFESIAEELGNE